MEATAPLVQITGSRMQDVLSLAPWGCALRLWREARGETPDYPKEEATGAMRRGTAGEALAAAEYARETGRKLRRHGPLTHADLPFGGHMDRHVVAFDERGPGVLEVKCPGIWEFNRVKREGLQEAYIAQIQWYLFLTGWRWGAYAIFNLETWQLLHWDVERNDGLIDAMVGRSHEFLRQVENGPAPEKLDAKDRRCSKCVYRKSCQQAAMLNLLSAEERGEDAPFDAALASPISELVELQGIEDEAHQLVEAKKKEIKETLGDRVSASTNGYRIVFRPTPRKGYTVKETVVRSLRVYPV